MDTVLGDVAQGLATWAQGLGWGQGTMKPGTGLGDMGMMKGDTGTWAQWEGGTGTWHRAWGHGMGSGDVGTMKGGTETLGHGHRDGGMGLGDVAQRSEDMGRMVGGTGTCAGTWGHGQNGWEPQGHVTGLGDMKWGHGTGHGDMGRMERGTEMWAQGYGTGQGYMGCVGRGTLGMHWVLMGIVTWGAGPSSQGLGRMGTWPWGHRCDWGGPGWYRGYQLVLGPLKHTEVTWLGRGAGVT